MVLSNEVGVDIAEAVTLPQSRPESTHIHARRYLKLNIWSLKGKESIFRQIRRQHNESYLGSELR